MNKERVVLTCWDYTNPVPYADKILVHYDSKEAAEAAVKKAVKDELAELNEGREKPYPFREDEDGDHTNIIRFWDGDDYMCVTAYDIHTIAELPDDGEKKWKYRGFILEELTTPDSTTCIYKMYPGEKLGYSVYRGVAKSFEEALDTIDRYHLHMETWQGKLKFEKAPGHQDSVLAYMTPDHQLSDSTVLELVRAFDGFYSENKLRGPKMYGAEYREVMYHLLQTGRQELVVNPKYITMMLMSTVEKLSDILSENLFKQYQAAFNLNWMEIHDLYQLKISK